MKINQLETQELLTAVHDFAVSTTTLARRIPPASVPAPVVYDVLKDLSAIGVKLPDALLTLANRVSKSADDYVLTEDDPAKHPHDQLLLAVRALHQAAHSLRAAGAALDVAQEALAHQGYQVTA